MTIPKNIVDKMEQVNSLISEIDRWFYDNLEQDEEGILEGTKHENTDYYGDYKAVEQYYQFADKPTGSKQSGGEYCEQHQDGCIEDSYYGKYYFPTEKGNYFWFEFNI